MASHKEIVKNSFLYSLKQSIPVFIGFLPVGLAYGILMRSSGYNTFWSGGCSLLVFAGSLQYLMIDFFTGDTSYFTVAIMAALLNSRHIFYGIPFLEKWSEYGAEKFFLIYALPDETFSLHISSKEEEGKTDFKYIYLFNAILVLVYWVVLSMLGGDLGKLITFDTSGMDFALTGLFVVIVIEQIRSSSSILPAVIGGCSSILCLIILGPSYFILPSLAITMVVLVVLRGKLEVKEDG